MIMNLVVILFVLFIAYLWTQQGLFSSFLHFVCTLVAGAIALAVWEPLVYGLLLGMREDLAWSMGLIVPFLLSLVMLRVASDKLIPGNLKFDDATDFVGGGVFGLGSGVITAGMLLLMIGFMNLPHNFAGYSPARYDASGSVVAGDTLWLPADAITVGLYERLSVGGFAAGSGALASRHPDLHRQAGLVRMTMNDRGRTTFGPGALKLLGTYRVADPAGTLADTFIKSESGEPLAQSYKYVDGEAATRNAEIFGAAFSFTPAAREKGSGQVVFGPGQIRLIVETPEGEVIGVHPAAVISQADGATLQFGRWRFDGPEVYVASTSSAAETRMAFEFPIPAGSTPKDLLVKNLRIPASEFGAVEGALPSYDSVAARDEAIRNGSIVGLSVTPGGPATASAPAAAAPGRTTGSGSITISGADRNAWFEAGLQIDRTLPSGPLDKSRLRGSASFNDADDALTTVNLSANKGDVTRSGGAQNLRVSQFAQPPNAQIVKVDISVGKQMTIANRAIADAAGLNIPVLVDSNGQQYFPEGYYIEDGEQIWLRFDPAQPIQDVRDMPRQVTRSAQNMTFVLIYRVTSGVSLSELRYGGRTVATFSPAILLD